jgi:hypothetical protein
VSGLLVAFGIVAVVAGLGASAWYFSEHARRIRELVSVDATRIADAKSGDIVRIVGVLRRAGHDEVKLLRAPLTGRKCAHYDVRVLELVSHGKNTSWVERISEVASQPFIVEDPSGRALVETARFECAIIRDGNRRSGTFHDATPAMEEILARHGMVSTGVLGLNRSLRYEEGVLEPGERVTVMGRARWEDDPEATAGEGGGYRTSARKQRLVIEAGTRAVRASDDPAATG